MRELQDQLEAEQYFSVSISTVPWWLCPLFFQCELHWLNYLSVFSDALQNSGQGT